MTELELARLLALEYALHVGHFGVPEELVRVVDETKETIPSLAARGFVSGVRITQKGADLIARMRAAYPTLYRIAIRGLGA